MTWKASSELETLGLRLAVSSGQSTSDRVGAIEICEQDEHKQDNNEYEDP